MATSYFILKMLKRKRKKSAIITRDEAQYKEGTDNTCVIKSKTYQCRICLNIGEIPIYSADNFFNVAEAIQTFGGIKLCHKDAFPKHLCKACFSLLKGAITFRKSALQTDELLKQVPAAKDYTSDDDMYHVSDENDTQHNHEKLKQFKCKTCKISFKSWEDYSNHRNSNHRNVRIQCPICYRLLTVSLYKKHLARHESASHLVCEVCGKLYRKDNLIRHLQLHSYELPFHCQVCPYRGRFLESLKIHMHTHTGYKPFACDKCNLRFLTRSNLNRHLLTHKQEKPFKCVECNRGFYTKRDMEVHFKGDHAGIKDFGCRLCGNKYGTRKSLMRHELRVHKRLKMAKGRIPLYLQAEYMSHNEIK
ncbi:hypothetical protein K1T71_013544 [Dendrolimus kikuchii]|uniref:Uncharacterized protein n=1 Tax=Dendrolimus kikuchii TaxID=765133 RepID=A0ACC1CH01_9NEOP|nr:hypothetical protein K1T71_013544 [Dendrolimus kikuchii]